MVFVIWYSLIFVEIMIYTAKGAYRLLFGQVFNIKRTLIFYSFRVNIKHG